MDSRVGVVFELAGARPEVEHAGRRLLVVPGGER